MEADNLSPVEAFEQQLRAMQQTREELAAQKTDLETDRDTIDKELVEVNAALEQIDAILAKSSSSGSNGGRNKRVEAHVYEELMALAKDGLVGVQSIVEEILIRDVMRKYPGLSRDSILSAIRRLADKGQITRLGTRRNRKVVLGLVKEAPEPTVEDKILKALAAAAPKGLFRRELIWEGQDMVEAEAVLTRLVKENKVTCGTCTGQTGQLEPDPVYFLARPLDGEEPPGRTLFDGADKP